MTSEYLQFDDEDQGNSNAYSHISPFGAGEDPYNNRIYYCYYEPSKILSVSHHCGLNGEYHGMAHVLAVTNVIIYESIGSDVIIRAG